MISLSESSPFPACVVFDDADPALLAEEERLAAAFPGPWPEPPTARPAAPARARPPVRARPRFVGLGISSQDAR